jgi:flagellar motor switch/type III secretory pathway protein FliN
MIAALRFGHARKAGGGTLRPLGFAMRSTLPLPAICLTANGVCEQMKRLLARDFEVDVVEPVILGSAAREVIFEDALVFRVRGRICDAFIVLRPIDARRLSAMAFGEAERLESVSLSEVERATLDSMLAAIAQHCVPLCGQIVSSAPEQALRAQTECVTYFELRILKTPSIAIGFALTNDPPEEATRYLQITDLLEVELEARVEVARGEVSFSSFASLDRESMVPLRTGLSENGTLRFGDAVFARGSCGVQSGSSAFVIGA